MLDRGRSGGKSGLVSCLLTLQRRGRGEGVGKFLREVSDRENERNNIHLNGEQFLIWREQRLALQPRCFTVVTHQN